MENENFINAYIEILTNTMTDAVIRNVSLQANLKINESVVEQQAKTVEQFRDTIRVLEQENGNLTSSQINSENTRIKELEEQVRIHLETISTLQPKVNDYENVKAQVNHLDTFRNELIKEREEHEKTRAQLTVKIGEHNTISSSLENVNATLNQIQSEKDNLIKQIQNQTNIIKSLNDKIEYLQLTPAQRKKVEEPKPALSVLETATLKDGGEF
jgi:chromosome segregation ATPase